MSPYIQPCAICGQARSCGVQSNSRICNSRKCEIAYEEHLNRGWACCASCGKLLQREWTSHARPVCNRSACQQQIARIRSSTASFCSVCGVYLVTHVAPDTVGLCGNIVCSRRHERKLADAHSFAKFLRCEARRQELNDITINQAAQIQPDSLATMLPKVVVLPYVEQKLSPLSLQRKNKFRATVLAMATEAIAINKQSKNTSTPVVERDELDADSVHNTADSYSDKSQRFDRLNGIACGTCGGKCCTPGGDHAFLNASLLCRVLDKRPGVSAEAITDAYMQQIPDETYNNSCIYHGIHGCGLPREMRALTCNAYLCYSLQLLRNSVEKGESNFLLAASNLRDAEDTSPEVYRIQVANDQETAILKSAPSDRRIL